ncbi:DUF2207 domain-containing protein [uncultured Anaerococcus sp.]|uniref:DUF2207 domain-containing protein n=1 Tax=uncultured Anaerococcus sp. TaxID=293428 RepID=UPI00260CD589|nr:DUF2207 domain-containing protein [uncultured Anaerococcus sp.]
MRIKKIDRRINIKRILKIVLLSLIILIPKSAYASDFDHIDINVDIDENGKADVKEEWQIDERDNDFTERYKNINNLKGIKIEDFKASLNGKEFSKKDPWNVDDDFDQKAYKYGSIKEDDEIELCWGVSDRSENNTYTLSYKINPVIIGLNDSDMLFFTFVGDGLDPKPEKVNIKINSYEQVNKDVKMWGFGFEGDINNENGSIIAKSDGDINNVNILLKFPKNTFATSYKEDKSFTDYANTAVKGSDWENNEGSVEEESESTPIWAFILIFLGVITGIFALVKAISNANPYKFSNIKDIPDIKNIKTYYYKDIPYNGNLEDLYLIAINAYPNRQNFDNFINAFFLRWLNEGAISFVEDKNDHGIFNKKIDYFIINHKPENMGEIEEDLFAYLIGAKSERTDDKLTEESFKRYMRKNHKSLENLSQRVDEASLKALIAKGYVEEVEVTKKLSPSGKTKSKLMLTDKGMELYKNFVGFNNYLENYQKIGVDEIESTEMLDQFMVYAAIFAISKETFDKFVKVYPEYRNHSFYNYYMMSRIHAYSSSASTSSQSFSSAGSGGAASFGGGAGGFGGGGGGGR